MSAQILPHDICMNGELFIGGQPPNDIFNKMKGCQEVKISPHHF